MQSPFLRIKPIGNMGNQMLQYMFALRVRQLVGQLEIAGYDIEPWGLHSSPYRDMRRTSLYLGGHLLDVDHIASLFRRGIVRDVTLAGLGFKLGNYAPVDFYRQVFKADHIAAEGYGSDAVVINIRGAEVLGGIHRDYGPIPFSYIDAVIENSGARPVFLGQIGDDAYSRLLRDRYPQAEFQPSRGALIDFEILRRSHQISMSVSTFSWLACWLSDARIIHYPMQGMFNPQQRPDIELTPIDDPRYRFYECEQRSWAGSEADLASLSVARDHPLLSPDRLHALQWEQRSKLRFYSAWRRARVDFKARFINRQTKPAESAAA
ncbi:MAG: hypothetical protein PW791_11315 [Neorhizobium sp.]|nr:hypothetical protein [Neorhizobium sp.]